MEVQIVSKKLIIPSTPNKDHPHSMKLSLFDQLARRSYVVFVLYYAEAETGDKTDRVRRMERSLADTLSVFYPLAGRFNEDDMSIDCNNHGAEFIQAKVSNNDLVLPRDGREPDPELLSRFVPSPYQHSSGEAPLVSVQANVFDCGGIALGFSLSHVLFDGYTVALFLKAWASACRNTDRVVDRAYHPSFDLGSIFPPRDTPVAQPDIDGPGIVTRRFVFDGRAMSRLRALGADDSGLPSRVQAVSGLLWRAMMRAKGRARPSLAFFTVNLRGRTKNVTIPLNSCGNFTTVSMALFNPKGEDDSVELHELVGLTRDAIGSAVARASSALDADGLMAMFESDWQAVMEAALGGEGRDVYCLTSWCRMSHYETDFGWGGPSWVSSVHTPISGFTLMMDARDGDGIEAWVSLELPTMLLLQQDPHIVAFTSNIHGIPED